MYSQGVMVHDRPIRRETKGVELLQMNRTYLLLAHFIFDVNTDDMIRLKCGKLVSDNNTLKPDNRKGIIQVNFDLAGLCHFIWSERDGTSIKDESELDIVIIPGEAVFEMVSASHCLIPLHDSFSPPHQTTFTHITDSRKTSLHPQILRRTF